MAADVTTYAMGICSASACAPAGLAPGAVADAVNAQWPTGIASAWAVADEPFAGGEPNPCPCNDDPQSRRHWLLHC